MSLKSILTAALATSLATSGACAAEKGKSLVVYFSLTGEQYNVGNITEGNTAIVAKMIAEQTGADLFELKTEKEYPLHDHKKLIDDAKLELNQKARPRLKADVSNFDQYDTVYIGYPIWWADMPMAVYTFMEAHKWDGKVIAPFATHEGSGFSGTDRGIKATCKGASVLKGLAIQGKVAQTNRPKAKKAVAEWLEK